MVLCSRVKADADAEEEDEDANKIWDTELGRFREKTEEEKRAESEEARRDEL